MEDTRITPVSSDLDLLRQQLERIGQLLAHQREHVVRSAGHDLAAGFDQLTDSLLPTRHMVRRLERKLQQQAREFQRLHALRDVSGLVNSSLDLAEVLNICMDSIIQLTGAERAFLMLTDPATGDLEVRTARNVDRETIASSHFSFSRSVVRHVARSGEAVVTTDAQDDPRFSGQKSVIDFKLRSILCVPLKNKEIITGVIYADNRVSSHIFHPEDRDLLASFADQAAIALENARLFRQIRNHLDSITEMKSVMEDVFTSIPSGVITIDGDDRVTLFNRAAAKILGVTHEAVSERPYSRALEMLQPDLGALVAAARRGTANAVAEVTLTVGEQRSTLIVTCAPLRNDNRPAPEVTVVVSDITQKKRLDSVRRYLPPALVDQIVDLDVAQQPERRRITTLFADIRNFSAVSEQLEPELLIQRINVYFTMAAQAISDEAGVIDKFMGDAVMATFNTSLNPQEEDHCRRAVRTALRLREAVEAYHQTVPAEERLFFGMGIHVGEAVVGNIGSQFRKDYSAVGDAVNLAKRLQEVADPGQILITREIFEAVDGWAEASFLDDVLLKGRTSPVAVYQLD